MSNKQKQVKKVVPDVKITKLGTEEKKPTIEQVAKTEVQSISGVNHGMSADTFARLGCLIQARYVEGNNLGKKYPSQFINTMNDYADVCVIGALVLASEEAKSRGGSLQLLLPPDKVQTIINAANSIGICLPEAKMIESKNGKETAVQAQLDFKDAKVPEAIEKAAKEQINATEVIELDPKKIDSLDNLYKAGSAILSDNKRGTFAKRVADAIDLYKTYYIAHAKTTEEKAAIDNKTIDEWINELIHTSNGNVIMKCLGTGMYTSVATTHCPIGAFLLLRKNVMDDKGNPIWTDQSIALAVRALVTNAAKDRIESMIDANGKPKEGAITDLKQDVRLTYLDTFSEDIITKVMDSAERKKDSSLKQIYGLALANFANGETTKTVSPEMQGVIKNKIGATANLFRPFDSQFSNYPSSLDSTEDSLTSLNSKMSKELTSFANPEKAEKKEDAKATPEPVQEKKEVKLKTKENSANPKKN